MAALSGICNSCVRFGRGRPIHDYSSKKLGKAGSLPIRSGETIVPVLIHVPGDQCDISIDLYKSTDGGETWDKVLFTADIIGAIDLVMASDSSQTLYASMWTIRPGKLYSEYANLHHSDDRKTQSTDVAKADGDDDKNSDGRDGR